MIRRLFSEVIDLVASIFLGVLMGTYFGPSLTEFYFSGFLDPESGLDQFEEIAGVLGSLIGILLVYIFHGLHETLLGQSLGKWICGIRIESVNGGHLLLKRATRSLIKFSIPWTTMVAGMSGWLLVASAGQIVGLLVLFDFCVLGWFLNRGLLDQLVDTRVRRKSNI